MPLRPGRPSAPRSRGQSLVEFALIFPVLMILIGAIVQFGVIFWGKYLFPPEVVTESRGEHASAEGEVQAAEATFERSGEEIARRSFLLRLLLGALGALGLAAVFPIRSLGPSPGRTLFETAWSAGARLAFLTRSTRLGSSVPCGKASACRQRSCFAMRTTAARWPCVTTRCAAPFSWF